MGNFEFFISAAGFIRRYLTPILRLAAAAQSTEQSKGEKHTRDCGLEGVYFHTFFREAEAGQLRQAGSEGAKSAQSSICVKRCGTRHFPAIHPPLMVEGQTPRYIETQGFSTRVKARTYRA